MLVSLDTTIRAPTGACELAGSSAITTPTSTSNDYESGDILYMTINRGVIQCGYVTIIPGGRMILSNASGLGVQS
eukprot:scaffold249312_cov72-Cyclotella_meneghiniana.AAC.8